jgi:transcriptional regulator with XRE-family HTH domain
MHRMAMEALAKALREKREAAGLSQIAVAQALGIRNTYLSQLESGKINTPSADVRRRLAQWLGVSHLDVLVMTDEIRPEEVAESGKVGVAAANGNDPAHELHALIDQINWYGRPDRVLYLKGLLDSMVAVDRQYKEEV